MLNATNADSTYTIRTVNGSDDATASATVMINGQTVGGSSDFNQNVEVIDRPLALALTHQLRMRVASTPGSY